MDEERVNEERMNEDRTNEKGMSEEWAESDTSMAQKIMKSESREDVDSMQEESRYRPVLRHPTERLIGGVCAGLADYLNLDPALVRIGWVVATLGTAGGGLLAYLALWSLLPVGTKHSGIEEPAAFELNEKNISRAGTLLIVFGLIWLLSNFGVLPAIWGAFWFVVDLLFWPALLIGLGALLIGNRRNWMEAVRNWRQRFDSRVTSGRESVQGSVRFNRGSIKDSLRRFRMAIPFKRSREDRIFYGVCGAIGRKLGIDANLVRLLWAAFSIGSVGTGVLIYVAAGLLLPEEKVASERLFGDEPMEVEIIEGSVSG